MHLSFGKKETVLVEVPGAYHNISARPSQLITKVDHIIAWFDKYQSIMKYFLLTGLFAFGLLEGFTQKVRVPAAYSNMVSDKQGLSLQFEGKKLFAVPAIGKYKVGSFTNVKGTNEGLSFNFAPSKINGLLYYGFIPLNDSRFPHPCLFGEKSPKSRMGSQM